MIHWQRDIDGRIRRIGRLPLVLEIPHELLSEVREGQLRPRWYAAYYQPYDRDSIVFAPMGLHWILRAQRWLYYRIQRTWPPEIMEIRRLRRQNKKLGELLHEATELLARTARRG